MIDLRDIDKDRDRHRVADWLSRPHVSKWWGDPAHRLEHFDTAPETQQALILRDGTPIGYLTWEIVEMETLRAVGLHDIPEGSIDVDIFIGEEGELGRGAGPAALRALVERLRATTDAPLAGLCTSVNNHRAQAAFEKAEFTRMTEFDDPGYGPCYVYVRTLR